MHYRALPRLATEGKRAMGEGKFWTMINKQPTRAELLATIEHRFARMGNFASNGYAQTETKPTQEAPPPNHGRVQTGVRAPVRRVWGRSQDGGLR
jgi:hypothetical protein